MARLVRPPYQAEGDGLNPSGHDPSGAIDWEALSPVPVRLAASVAARIEEMVVSGRLPQGRQLPSERRLAELLGVSRGSVREAITELEVKGLVTRRPGSGTHVQARSHSLFTSPIVSGIGLSDRETTELLDLREAVEPGIAARAAERATEADIEEIRGLADAFAASGDSVERRIELDAQFHQAIARATHNSLLAGLVERFMHALDATRRTSAQTPSRWRMSKTAHRKIVAAIAAGDPEAAEREMLEHVRATAGFLAQSQQRSGRRPLAPQAKGDAP
jgi:GntR family transcriptional repressor for pyruvate dehydrogenase complex